MKVYVIAVGVEIQYATVSAIENATCCIWHTEFLGLIYWVEFAFIYWISLISAEIVNVLHSWKSGLKDELLKKSPAHLQSRILVTGRKNITG